MDMTRREFLKSVGMALVWATTVTVGAHVEPWTRHVWIDYDPADTDEQIFEKWRVGEES